MLPERFDPRQIGLKCARERARQNPRGDPGVNERAEHRGHPSKAVLLQVHILNRKGTDGLLAPSVARVRSELLEESERHVGLCESCYS